MGRRVLQFQFAVLRHLAVPGLAFLIGIGSALAQSGPQDQSGKPAANSAASTDATKDSQRKTNEFVEAAQVINGPAGNPECVWLGRRMVRLMWSDDLDTAFRHLDLYDRFGWEIDSKVPESLDRHVHACWINPNAQPQAAAAAQPVPPATAAAVPPTP